MQVFAPIGAERNPCPCVSEAQRFQFLGGYRFAFVPGKEGTDHFMAIPSFFFCTGRWVGLWQRSGLSRSFKTKKRWPYKEYFVNLESQSPLEQVIGEA